VSFSIVAEWFDGVKAPYKALVWLKHDTAHEVFNEEPGGMLAEKAGDVALGPQEAVLVHSAAPCCAAGGACIQRCITRILPSTWSRHPARPPGPARPGGFPGPTPGTGPT
jgi:hypothetical protein